MSTIYLLYPATTMLGFSCWLYTFYVMLLRWFWFLVDSDLMLAILIPLARSNAQLSTKTYATAEYAAHSIKRAYIHKHTGFVRFVSTSNRQTFTTLLSTHDYAMYHILLTCCLMMSSNANNQRGLKVVVGEGGCLLVSWLRCICRWNSISHTLTDNHIKLGRLLRCCAVYLYVNCALCVF